MLEKKSSIIISNNKYRHISYCNNLYFINDNIEKKIATAHGSFKRTSHRLSNFNTKIISHETDIEKFRGDIVSEDLEAIENLYIWTLTLLKHFGGNDILSNRKGHPLTSEEKKEVNLTVQKLARVPGNLKKKLREISRENSETFSENFRNFLEKASNGTFEITQEKLDNAELSKKHKDATLKVRITEQERDYIEGIAETYNVTQDAVFIFAIEQGIENYNASKKKEDSYIWNDVSDRLLKKSYEKYLSCDLGETDSGIKNSSSEIAKRDEIIKQQQDVIQYLIMSGIGGRDDKSD